MRPHRHSLITFFIVPFLFGLAACAPQSPATDSVEREIDLVRIQQAARHEPPLASEAVAPNARGTTRGRLLSAEHFESLDADELELPVRRHWNDRESSPAIDPEDGFGPLSRELKPRRVVLRTESYAITYETVRLEQGRLVPQRVSARFIVPEAKRRTGPRSIPLVALQHPTQLLRTKAPSQVRWWRDNTLTVPLGYLLAFMGYAVVMPDMPGMGVNGDAQAFCLRSAAHSIRDAVEAVTSDPSLWPTEPLPVRWDGRLFLMGYSAGAHASLVTAEALQDEGVRVDGVALLGAPLSLSGVMRSVMLRDDEPPDAVYPHPFYMPLLVKSYDAYYGNRRPPVTAFDFFAALRPVSPDAEAGAAAGDGAVSPAELLAMLDGTRSGREVSQFIHSHEGYRGPRSLLAAPLLQALEEADPRHPAMAALRENDAPRRGFRPAMPLLFAHHVLDDAVPYANVERALEALGPAQAAERFESDAPQVDVQGFFEAIPRLSSIHEGAAPFAMLRGVRWIDRLAYPRRPAR